MSEEVEDDLTLDDITFRDKTLSEWEKELTVKVPALPTTSLAIQNTVAHLNNQYQVAYNCYNELMVLYTSASRTYKSLLDVAIKAKLEQYKADGVKRAPGKEVLEALCLEDDDGIKLAQDNKTMLGLIRDYFDNNKCKLEKSMQLVLNISFGVGQSDRMHYKSGDPRS